VNPLTQEDTTMATIKGPRGRMTKPLTTPYEVGDRVRLVADETWSEGLLSAGDVGPIRRIFISCPNDGDETFLLFDVEWEIFGGRMTVVEEQITPAADTEAHRWLRRQLDGLDVRAETRRQEG
jgi:hypothetical protein